MANLLKKEFPLLGTFLIKVGCTLLGTFLVKAGCTEGLAAPKNFKEKSKFVNFFLMCSIHSPTEQHRQRHYQLHWTLWPISFAAMETPDTRPAAHRHTAPGPAITP
jgi:hypothetical protein